MPISCRGRLGRRFPAGLGALGWALQAIGHHLETTVTFHIALHDVQEIVIREHIPQRMKILDRNSHHLLVPDRRQRVMMYGRELPPCLFQQVTKLGDCAFFAVEKTHHLRREKQLAQLSENRVHCPYHHIEFVYYGSAAEVGKQGLGGYGKLCAGNFMCRRFIAGVCQQLFDNDELCLRDGSSMQMFQYSETMLVRPVVKYSAQEEDGNVILLRGLWFKEVMTLGTRGKLADKRGDGWRRELTHLES